MLGLKRGTVRLEMHNPEWDVNAAQEYDALKLSLYKEHANDRGSYTSGKSQLIDRLLNEAREWAEQH